MWFISLRVFKTPNECCLIPEYTELGEWPPASVWIYLKDITKRSAYRVNQPYLPPQQQTTASPKVFLESCQSFFNLRANFNISNPNSWNETNRGQGVECTKKICVTDDYHVVQRLHATEVTFLDKTKPESAHSVPVSTEVKSHRENWLCPGNHIIHIQILP